VEEDHKGSKEYNEQKERYMKEFNAKDRGEYDQKEKKTIKYDKEDYKEMEEREDLWITHIMRKKREQEIIDN